MVSAGFGATVEVVTAVVAEGEAAVVADVAIVVVDTGAAAVDEPDFAAVVVERTRPDGPFAAARV